MFQLLMEQEFIQRQNTFKPVDNKRRAELKLVQAIRGTPVALARIHEIFNDGQVPLLYFLLHSMIDSSMPLWWLKEASANGTFQFCRSLTRKLCA